MQDTNVLSDNKLKCRDGFTNEYVNVFGVGEKDFYGEIEKLKNSYCQNFVIDGFWSFNEGTAIFSYRKNVDKNIVDSVIAKFADTYKNYVYSVSSECLTLEQVFVEKLKLAKLRLSIAESLTGGEIASRIVSVPGASEVFYEGVVSYANQSKIDRLGVNVQTLKDKGAVSEDVAYEMAKGILQKTNSDIVIATTGIAGPTGETKNKPLGLVYIAVGTKQKIAIFKNEFVGDRQDVREFTVRTALAKALDILKEQEEYVGWIVN